MLPFARNESTRFISPTKTPEYLAAGCPVVSTSIRDVVRPYGQQGLARIADTPAEFVEAIDAALHEDAVGAAGQGRRVPEPDVVGPHLVPHAPAGGRRRPRQARGHRRPGADGGTPGHSAAV